MTGVAETETQEAALPVFTEYAWDFDHDCFRYDDKGQHITVTGNDAIEVWVYKTLKTERYRYGAYFDDYGIELEKYIGTGPNDSQRAGELYQTIKEGLLVNPYIKAVSVLRVTQTHKKVTMQLDLKTVYGEMVTMMEV